MSPQEEQNTPESTADIEAADTGVTSDAGDANDSIVDAVPSDADSQNVTDVRPLPDFSAMVEQAAAGSINLLKDVELNVKIELGRSELSVEEILKLNDGSVVELNKLAGDPVDVLVNEQLIARGEVLVLNDNFCVRINEILPGMTERLART